MGGGGEEGVWGGREEFTCYGTMQIDCTPGGGREEIHLSPGPYLYIKFEYEADKEEMIYLFLQDSVVEILTIFRLLEKNTCTVVSDGSGK